MKKIIIAILLVLFSIPNASAQEAELEEGYLKGVYFVQTKPNGEYYTHQQAIFKFQGKIAYCLNPELAAKPGNYTITEGLRGSYLSDEEKQKIEEIGYYGYEYPNHQTIYYYLAAQELIWELVSKLEITWETRANRQGENIDIEKEKNEILKLIEENKKLPSFEGQEISVYEGETIILEDQNNVLKNFQMDFDNLIIEDNKLKIENISKNMKIKGFLKSYDSEVTLLYRQDGSQKLSTLRLSDPPSFEISICVIGIQVEVHKLGEVWKGIVNTGEWSKQSGVELELYAAEDIYGNNDQILYQKDQYIETLITKKGIAKTKPLPYGNYYLKEIKSKEGYSNMSHFEFKINNSVEKNPIIEVKNYLSTGKLEITKKDRKGQLLAGVVFGLYSKNGKKIDEKVTDEEGKIVWDRLPLGDYIIKEIQTIDGYQLDDTKNKVTILENQTVYLEKINQLMLPNTSRKTTNYFGVIYGLWGIIIGRKLITH